MSNVGIVLAPYITCDYHQLLTFSTLASLRTFDTAHQISVYAVVNSYRTENGELERLKESVDWLEVNDCNNLSRAWNKGINKALSDNVDYILVCNLDIIFHPNFLDNLIRFFNNQSDVLICSGQEWNSIETLHHAEHSDLISAQANFSCFLFDRRLIEIVGLFDEQFVPAYHEDSDMRYRIKLAGYRDCATYQARFYHNSRSSLTGLLLNNDQSRLQQTRALMNASTERYLAKWGGLPDQECFTIPYSSASKNKDLQYLAP